MQNSESTIKNSIRMTLLEKGFSDCEENIDIIYRKELSNSMGYDYDHLVKMNDFLLKK